jgi:uncharacterized Fe-S cluster protein YjdI
MEGRCNVCGRSGEVIEGADRVFRCEVCRSWIKTDDGCVVLDFTVFMKAVKKYERVKSR